MLRRDDLATLDDEFGILDDSGRASKYSIDKIDLEDEVQDVGSDQKLLSFEIDPQQVEKVKKQCIEMELPMLEEYDFR